MSFVNEYASDEDVDRYELNKIWDKYYIYDKGNYFRGERPDFTIDRERNIFLMVVGGDMVGDYYRYKFLLYLGDVEIISYLYKTDEGSSDLEDNPYVIVWGLKKIDIPENLDLDDSEVKNILKEAVAVYGYAGAKRQLSELVVKFDF